MPERARVLNPDVRKLNLSRRDPFWLTLTSGERAKMRDYRSRRDSEIVRQIALKLRSRRSKGLSQKDGRNSHEFHVLFKFRY